MTKLDTEPRKPDTYVLGRSLPHHWTGIGEVKLNGCEPGSEENAANARLIAGAPDLLAACEALADFTRELLKLVTPDQIKAANLTTRMLKINDQGFNALTKARGEK